MSKKNKKMIGVSLLLLFALCVFTFIITKMTSKGINKVAMTRTSEEVNTGEIFFDDEALALSSDIDMSENLRNEAINCFNNINQLRVNSGLKPLVWDSNLEQAACVRVVESSTYFSHTRPNGKAWYTVNSKIQGGENLAYGYNSSTSVVNAWMNSPSHAYNILYSKFTKAAISIYYINGTMYWAQEFGY